MKFTLFFLLCLTADAASAQLPTRLFKEKKVKSITTTVYTKDSVKRQSEKRYYSVKGYDSVVYINDVLTFIYMPKLRRDGRVEMLTR